MREISLASPHRRRNPLTGDWVLVSPQRTSRPWLGQVDAAPVAPGPPYDPGCYLCPGNSRAGGARNPSYDGTFVFPNDFPAMLPDSPPIRRTAHPLFAVDGEAGTCRVICFSPRHDLTLAELPEAGIRRVIETWIEQVQELGRTYRWVQIFENKGEMMGSSNPHPHGQIWAGTALPTEAAKEDRNQRGYLMRRGSPLLLDYAEIEAREEHRIVAENEEWLVVVPFWALWPFELLLLPRRHVQRLPDLDGQERHSLASILRRLLARYDNLFRCSFPYSMGWHGAPTGPDGRAQPHWQLHAHFYPPLLRSATVRKFMVGYELLAEPQRDLTAEEAAQRLRSLPDVHYKLQEPDEHSATSD